jgi:hypothetical protein
MNEDEAGKPAYSEFNSIKPREESMTKKIANSPFRINCCKSGRDAFSL